MKLHQLMGFTPGKESEPVATGFKKLDDLTGGLHIGKICTIVAPPGMGKTWFSVSLLRNIGMIQKVPTAFLTLEYSEMEIVKRLKLSLTGAFDKYLDGPVRRRPPENVVREMEKAGFCNKKEWDAYSMMKAAPVWIESGLGVSVNEIVSLMERLHQENRVRVLFIDGADWIRFPGNSEDQERAMKQLYQAANWLKMSVVLTSMPKRSVDYQGGHREPELCDLDNSFGLASYSSTVMFIYRPEYYKILYIDDLLNPDDTPSPDDETKTSTKGWAIIRVERNMFGNTSGISLHFDYRWGFNEWPSYNEFPF